MSFNILCEFFLRCVAKKSFHLIKIDFRLLTFSIQKKLILRFLLNYENKTNKKTFAAQKK